MSVVRYDTAEIERLTGCLGRLLPHTHPEKIALTGSVAMELRLAEQGAGRVRTTLTDLDFIVSSPSAVGSTVAAQFLVSHYHVVGPGVRKFTLQLVDPDSGLRIDVFPDLTGSLGTAGVVPVDGLCFKVLSLTSIFDHKLSVVTGASREKPVDPKHYRDLRALGAVLDREVPEVSASCLAKDVYETDVGLICRRCQLSEDPRFRLAPKREILSILGYV